MLRGAEIRETREEVLGAWDATNREPDNIEAWRELARRLLRGGSPGDALVPFERIAVLCPTPDALFDLGEAYLDAGLYTFAKDAFRLVICSRPDDPDAWGRLGLGHMNEGEYEEALEAFARARALDPEYMTAYPNAADAEQIARATLLRLPRPTAH